MPDACLWELNRTETLRRSFHHTTLQHQYDLSERMLQSYALQTAVVVRSERGKRTRGQPIGDVRGNPVSAQCIGRNFALLNRHNLALEYIPFPPLPFPLTRPFVSLRL